MSLKPAAAHIYSVRRDPVATFYSPVTRFWELSAGSMLAYLTLKKHLDSSRFSGLQLNLVSVFGLIFLLLGLVFTKKEHAFPGWWALLPVIGSLLIILAGPKSLVNRVILSNKTLVWFGLISFPLYLWHWPILSFGRIIVGETPDLLFRSTAIPVSIILAWLTYRYVENPIRYKITIIL